MNEKDLSFEMTIHRMKKAGVFLFLWHSTNVHDQN